MLDARGMRRFWIASIAVLAVQLAALIVYSNHLYSHFDLSVDFAHNVQAWYLIGHGSLDPVDTVRITATPFWRDHFDLILWPLSLLRWLSPQPIILLWLQDAAIVASEVVTLLWVSAILSDRLAALRNTVGIVALIALVANPWWYEAASFDVHMPPLGLPFVILAGYSLWNAKFARACVAAGLALLFGAVVVELIAVVALAALCSSKVRHEGGARWAAGIAVMGIAWIVVVNAIGANQASNLASNYGYLANPAFFTGATPNASIFEVLKAVVLHPSRVTHALSQRWRAVVFELESTGFIGLVTPWGLFMFLGLLIPSALTASSGYSLATSGAFQNLPAMPFLYVGSVLALTRIASTRLPSPGDGRDRDRPRWRSFGPLLASVLALIGTVVVVSQGALMVSRVPKDFFLVSATEASTLQTVESTVPTDAEVIASYGAMGRFAERRYILTLAAAPQTFAVSAPKVFFLITPSLGTEPLEAADAKADIAFTEHSLGARLLINSNGISLLEWSPPPGVRTVELPGKRGNDP